MKNFKQIIKLTKLFSIYKKKFIKILVLMVSVSIIESLGVTMVLPVMEKILNGGLSKNFSILNKISTNPSVLILFIISLMLLLSIFKLLLRVKLMKESTNLTWGIKEKWSNEIYKLAVNGSYQYITSRKQGELINKMSSQPLIACVTLDQLIQFYSLLFMLLSYTIFMLIIDYKITLLVLLFAFFYYYVASKYTSKKATEFSLKRYSLYKIIDETIAETISMIKQIKVFSMEGNLINKFIKLNSEVKIAQTKFSIINVISSSFIEIQIVVLLLCVFSFNFMYNFFDVKEMMPTLIVFGLIGLRMMSQASSLVSAQIKILSNTESLASVNEIIKQLRGNEKKSSKGVSHIEKIHSNIVIKDLTFSFDSSSKIINYGSFSIPIGKYTAIVGESGSGKSTFVDILMKFYEPKSGNIFVNGLPLTELDENNWRNNIGYVSQEPELFNDTILNNIKLSSQFSTREEIIKVAKKCHIHDFILSLDNGYETIIGDRGVMLSGGQKQRVAIARALIRDPQILIFDEATSALDDETENIIKDTIEGIRHNKTIIAIAHRKTTIEKSDVVLDFNK